jgi:phage recombination protein Bet
MSEGAEQMTMTDTEATVEPMHETDPATLPAVVEHSTPGVTFSAQQIDLIKETVCNPGVDRQGRQQYATDAELDLFLAVCRRTGLDPFARQIYAVFRWNKSLGRNAMQIQTSIDGFRVIAERSSTYAGQAGPFWCGPDGIWTDVWLSSDYPAAAKVGVLRRGFTEPMFAVAKWAEFVQTKADGKVSQMWEALPTVMLAKCAEAQALRRAFPNDLSGLYTAEEMAQADNPARSTETPPAARQAPSPDEPFTPKAVAQIRAACADAGFTEDDIADMVEMGTEGRCSTLEEVTYGERPALARAKQHIVERKATLADDGLPANPESDVDEQRNAPNVGSSADQPTNVDPPGVPSGVMALFAEMAPRVQKRVDPADKKKATADLYKRLIPGLAALSVPDDEEQRAVLSVLLGRTVRSRRELTASEARAVLDQIEEETR